MAIVKKKVDAVIVGMGWTGAIMAKELTDAGLHVVVLERGMLGGGSALLAAAPGLQGQPVSASLLVAAPGCDAALLEAWRAIEPVAGCGAVTLLPGLLVARWLGPACEPGRHWFARLWAAARPAVAGRAAHTPRIWNT